MGRALEGLALTGCALEGLALTGCALEGLMLGVAHAVYILSEPVPSNPGVLTPGTYPGVRERGV